MGTFLEAFWRRQHQSGVFKDEQEPPCGTAGCVCGGEGTLGFVGFKVRLVVVGNEAGGGMRLGLHLTREATKHPGVPGTEGFPNAWDFKY